MKSRALFFNPEIVKNNLKRFWWIMALFVLLLFLVSPMDILQQNAEYMIKYSRTIDMNDVFEGTMPLIIIFPVLISALVFRYLQTSKSVTLLHSMPYTRADLYKSNVVSGFIMTILPILINTLILLIISLFTKFGMFFEDGVIIDYLAYSFFITTALYSVACMVGMVTGSSIAHIIFTYIFNLLPLAAVAGIGALLEGVLYGFPGIDSLVFDEIGKCIPLIQMGIVRNVTKLNLFVIDAIITVAMLVIGYYIYKFRNLETAGDVISNKYIKPIFKYGVTASAAICGGLYIKGIFSLDSVNILIYLVFGLIGYVIAEMLLRKSVKILDSYKGFLAFAIVTILVILGVRIDIFGFENRIPNIDKVDYVVLGRHYQIDSIKEQIDDSSYLMSTARAYQVIKEKDNIQKVIDLHSKVISEKRDEAGNNILITYKLKNGKLIQREYQLGDGEQYKEELKTLYNTLEYKREAFPILRLDINQIKDINIESNFIRGTNNLNKEQQLRLIELLKETILESSYEQFNSDYLISEENYIPLYNIEIMLNEQDKLNVSPDSASTKIIVTEEVYRSLHFNVNKNMPKVVNYLRECGITTDDYMSNSIKLYEIRDGITIETKIITDVAKIKEFLQYKGEFREMNKADESYYRVALDDMTIRFAIDNELIKILD